MKILINEDNFEKIIFNWLDEKIPCLETHLGKLNFLLICCDSTQGLENSGGLVNLSCYDLKETLAGQNLEVTSTRDHSDFSQIQAELKQWHSQISKVEVDLKNMEEIPNLEDTSYDNDHIHTVLSEIPLMTRCLDTHFKWEIFKKQPHKVVDIRVCFQLVKKIIHVDEYNVNFSHLHKLLCGHIQKWNCSQSPELDEITLHLSQLPYAGVFKYTPDDEGDICYVRPKMYLVNFLNHSN